MKKNKLNLLISILFFFAIRNLAIADSLPALNHKYLERVKVDTFDFFITGHLYGDSYNKSGLPINTIYSAVDLINAKGSLFLVSLGDIFLNPEKDIDSYSKTFFKSIRVPIFNAVGNHDVMGGLYRKKYDKTYFSYTIGSCAFIFLDAELNDSKIIGDQFDFFKSSLLKYGRDLRIKSIFIFSHRPVWAEQHPEISKIFKFNTRSSSVNNFNDELVPLIRGNSNGKNVFWCSGSMDVSPASFFYHYDSNSKITFIQTAVRGTNHDGLLKVKVINDSVSFETISLTGSPLLNLVGYDIQFFTKGWRKDGNQFNYRLIPLYIKQSLTSKYFWYGIIVSLGFMLVLYFFIRKFKR